jgi:hypothetical protein
VTVALATASTAGSSSAVAFGGCAFKFTVADQWRLYFQPPKPSGTIGCVPVSTPERTTVPLHSPSLPVAVEVLVLAPFAAPARRKKARMLRPMRDIPLISPPLLADA